MSHFRISSFEIIWCNFKSTFFYCQLSNIVLHLCIIFSSFELQFKSTSKCFYKLHVLNILHYTFFFLSKTWFQPRSSGAAMKTPGWPGLHLRGRGTDQMQKHGHKNWLVLCFEWDTKALYWFQISCEGIKIYFTPLKSVFFIYLVNERFKQDTFLEKFTRCCSTKSNLRAEYLWVLCSC